jgi:hypothetical protein
VSALWKRVYATVFPKAEANAARKQLTKLANERFDPLPWISVDEERWGIRSELWDLAQLACAERKHTTLGLRHVGGPLVVVEFRGRVLLVDGTHRVNEWLSVGSPGEHEVLIVSYLSDVHDP